MKWLSLVLLVGMAFAQHCRKIDNDKSSGFCTVSDPALTPGEMDPSLACVSNADRPRSLTNSEKNAILSAYGYPANTDKSTGEFDHWFPHWMGGSDGPKNIWFEPHAGKFGSRTKDKVELLGVNPKTETLVKAHLAERTASGKETSGAVSERVPADGGRAIEELRQHRGA